LSAQHADAGRRHGGPPIAAARALHARGRAAIAYASLALCLSAHATDTPRWLDPSLSPDKRAELLNRELTLDERIGLVHGILSRPDRGITLPPDAIISAGYVPGVPRLGIPALYETDASLGITNPQRLRPGDGATAFPASLVLAATFSPELAYSSGVLLGNEARAKGFNVLLGPGVNLARDARNGRNFEYFSEDPLLSGILGGENIRGIQSNHIIATIKHFALNDQETHRHWVNAQIDPAALRESDLLAFELGIERGQPGSVMCAYNQLNGPYACGNDFLLNQVLKKDWSYPGWVMSDWGAVYATDFAIHGLDQQSGQQADAKVWFGDLLKQAVQSGAVPETRLADMTRRILRAMFANGLFDFPTTRNGQIDYAAHTKAVRDVAAQGIVLLRNRDDILPLTNTAKRILVVGGYADLGVLSGGGSSQVYEPDTDWRSAIRVGGGGRVGARRSMVFQSSAPLDAIRARAAGATVTFDDGRYPAAAAARARQADVVIVFATQWMTENEDAPDMSLPQGQGALIAALAQANPHTVVVLETGGAVEMPWLDQTAAVLEAWYPGTGGADAIADILFGQVNPSGRLPVTFPRSASQYPHPQIAGWELPDGQYFPAPHPEGAAVGYRWFAQKGEQPLFPFGFGLSYTHFTYKDLQLHRAKTLTVSFSITNTGTRVGADVPQAYLVSANGEQTRRLVGFQRVTLSPGQTTHVELNVDPRLLAHFDAQAHHWRVSAGSYEISIAPNAIAGNLTSAVHLPGIAIRP
jgi:beta-glucosidase